MIDLFGNETEAPKKAYNRIKRNWENRFQRWSDKNGLSTNNTTSFGCCGYGSMCDWCDGEHNGRECIRALNSMLKAQKIKLDYEKATFNKVWGGLFDEV